jgi:hypothetical protein
MPVYPGAQPVIANSIADLTPAFEMFGARRMDQAYPPN